ncbi:multiple epidermal growth factor-like domains protein 6 [Ylistrum balloti]|uniref:multiple epidermal growth factor-like domains protein 6 n=1 Tax=Ylistrum balloti TaxID=509963 RepID=UPI002905E06D|nr:multiple epidermal growth factor-like domains protein 6 [Ylistrum balloti]
MVLCLLPSVEKSEAVATTISSLVDVSSLFIKHEKKTPCNEMEIFLSDKVGCRTLFCPTDMEADGGRCTAIRYKTRGIPLDLLFESNAVIDRDFTFNHFIDTVLEKIAKGLDNQSCPNCDGNCFNNTDICNGTCVSGFFGEECGLNCTTNCRYGCNRTTGVCNSCAKGFYGENCNETCPENCYSGCRQSGSCFGCYPFWFGDRCDQKCPVHCDKGCDAATGECIYGCKSNFWGTESCNKTCFVNCYNPFGGPSCIQMSGSCIRCKPGYTGLSCKERCIIANCDRCSNEGGIPLCYQCLPGFTGRDCNGSCPAHCKDNTCDQLTGACTCAEGWYGDDCSMPCFGNCALCVDNSTCIACIDGYYGDRCEKRCPSNCEKCSRDGKSCPGMCNGWDENYGPICACRRSECAQRESGSYKCLKCKKESWFTQDSGCCPCSDHCNGSCDGVNGTCTYGCLADYHGPTCDTQCSTHCNGSCDLDTGECEQGCQDDWVTPTCDIQCSVNFPHCKKCLTYKTPQQHDAYCSGCAEGYHIVSHGGCVPCDHCLNRNCNTTTGECFGPCVDGYFHSTLNFCDGECNENCIDGKCNNNDGNCTKGCVPGYYTERCLIDCPSFCSADGCNRDTGNCHKCADGTYGEYCFSSCPTNCLTKSCDRQTGACSECKLGYYGETCDTRCHGCLDVTCSQTKDCETGCMPGKHGRYCEKKCSENCYVCDQDTGMCLMCITGFSGVGFRGANCSIPCPDCVNEYEKNTYFPFHGSCYHGSFGQLCMKNCGNCFHSTGFKKCEKFSGYCSNGCASGYYGLTCEEECRNCQPDTNNMTVCDFTSGSCQDGCLAGHFGLTCNFTCGNNCLNNICERTDGSCVDGCISGWQGDQCNIAKRTQNSGSSLSGGKIAGIIIGIVFGVAFASAVIYFVIRSRKRNTMKRTRVPHREFSLD